MTRPQTQRSSEDVYTGEGINDRLPASSSPPSSPRSSHGRGPHSRSLSAQLLLPPQQRSPGGDAGRAEAAGRRREGKTRQKATAAASQLSDSSAPSSSGAGPVLSEAAVSGAESSLSKAWQVVQEDWGERVRAVLCGKGCKWSEVVDALTEVRVRMERAKGVDREERVRASLWLLLDSPGFSVVHLAVLRAACDTCERLLEEPPIRVSAAFVRAAAPQLLLRLAERKTAAMAQPLLLALAAACSPRALQGAIAALLPSCQQTRVVEAAFPLLSSLLSRFGVCSLHFPGLVGLIRSHVEHPHQGVRVAALQLLQALYQHTGPTFRASLLSLVNASAEAAAELAFQRVEEEEQREGRGWRASTPPLRARGEGSEWTAVTLDAAFPKVELSARVGEELLAKLRQPQWRARQEALEEVGAVLRSSQHRVTLRDCTLLTLLSPLLSDSNKAIQLSALALLSSLLRAVPEALHRHRDKLLPPLVQSLSDARKGVRDEGGRVLGEWLSAVGLGASMKWLLKGLEGVGRRDVLAVLVRFRDAEAEWADAVPLLLDGLCDRSGEVRALSGRLVDGLIHRGGGAQVASALQRMKPAYQRQAQQTLDALQAAMTAKKDSRSARSAQAGDGADAETAGAAVQAAAEAAEAVEEQRRPKAPSTGPKRKATEATLQRLRREGEEGDAAAAILCLPAAAASASAASAHPFLVKADWPAKQRRLAKDAKRLHPTSFRDWSSEEREELFGCLSAVVSPSLLHDMQQLQLSADFSRVLAAVDFFSAQLQAAPSMLHAIADLLLRWASSLLSDANPKLLLALLSFLRSLLASLASAAARLSDAELSCLLPFLIEKGLGHSVSAIRRDTAALLTQLSDDSTCATAKLIAALISGLDSRNKRVLTEACECIARLWGPDRRGGEVGYLKVEGGGSNGNSGGLSVGVSAAVWGEMRRGLPVMAQLLSSTSDPSVRLSVLSAVVSAEAVVGDTAVWGALEGEGGGAGLPEKVRSMIEERLRRVRLDAMRLHPTPSSHTAAPAAASSSPSSSHSRASPSTPARSAAPPSPQWSPLSHRSPSPLRPLPRTPSSPSRTRVDSLHPLTASCPSASPSRPSALCASPTLADVSAARSHLPRAMAGEDVPSLSSLTSSLASLEAMQASLSTTAWSRAPPLHLPSLLMAMQGGSDEEQLRAVLSLSTWLPVNGVQPLIPHAALIGRCLVRVLHCAGGHGHVEGAAAAVPRRDEGRREAVAVLRCLVAHPALVHALHADDARELVEAVLSFTAAQLTCRGDHISLRSSCLACAHTLLDSGLHCMERFTLLSHCLLNAMTASDPEASSASPLSSLLQPLLLRWSTSISPAVLDLPLLLSSLHRLFLALPPFPSPLHSTLHSVLSCVVSQCSSAKVSEIMRGFPVDAPIVVHLRALICGQEGEEQRPHRAQHCTRQQQQEEEGHRGGAEAREAASATTAVHRLPAAAVAAAGGGGAQRGPQRPLPEWSSSRPIDTEAGQRATTDDSRRSPLLREEGGCGKQREEKEEEQPPLTLDELMRPQQRAQPSSSFPLSPSPSISVALSTVEAARPSAAEPWGGSSSSSYLERFQQLQQRWRVGSAPHPSPPPRGSRQLQQLPRLLHPLTPGPSTRPLPSPLPTSSPLCSSPHQPCPIPCPALPAKSAVPLLVPDATSLSSCSRLTSAPFDAIRDRIRARQATPTTSSATPITPAALAHPTQPHPHMQSLPSLLLNTSTAAAAVPSAVSSVSALLSVASATVAPVPPSRALPPAMAGGEGGAQRSVRPSSSPGQDHRSHSTAGSSHHHRPMTTATHRCCTHPHPCLFIGCGHCLHSSGGCVESRTSAVPPHAS